MEFLFHSVYQDGAHAKYYNIYKVSPEKYYAECHHFNRARSCEGDFEIMKEGNSWKASDEHFEKEAAQISDEIRSFSEA